jgi:hypothetical protein
MAFKKSLVALVSAFPLVLGTRLFFLVNIDAILTIVAGASISTRNHVPEKCKFLLPIVDNLVHNLFTNECGDAVGLDAPHDKQDCVNTRLGSRRSPSPLPRCYWNFPDRRVSALLSSEAP